MTDSDIKNLAHLARIEVTDAEVQKFKSEIGPILDYVAQIDNAEITDGESEQVLKNVSREDIPQSNTTDSLDLIMQNAPEKENGFFKVPKIL